MPRNNFAIAAGATKTKIPQNKSIAILAPDIMKNIVEKNTII